MMNGNECVVGAMVVEAEEERQSMATSNETTTKKTTGAQNCRRNEYQKMRAKVRYRSKIWADATHICEKGGYARWVNYF